MWTNTRKLKHWWYNFIVPQRNLTKTLNPVFLFFYCRKDTRFPDPFQSRHNMEHNPAWCQLSLTSGILSSYTDVCPFWTRTPRVRVSWVLPLEVRKGPGITWVQDKCTFRFLPDFQMQLPWDSWRLGSPFHRALIPLRLQLEHYPRLVLVRFTILLPRKLLK